MRSSYRRFGACEDRRLELYEIKRAVLADLAATAGSPAVDQAVGTLLAERKLREQRRLQRQAQRLR